MEPEPLAVVAILFMLAFVGMEFLDSLGVAITRKAKHATSRNCCNGAHWRLVGRFRMQRRLLLHQLA